MRMLVTGGTGFIGSHFVERMICNGRQVRVLDNMSSGHLSNLSRVAGEFELVDADVRDLAAVRKAMAGCDVVVHMAAPSSMPQPNHDPSTIHNVNATVTLNVLMAAREVGVSRVV